MFLVFIVFVKFYYLLDTNPILNTHKTKNYSFYIFITYKCESYKKAEFDDFY